MKKLAFVLAVVVLLAVAQAGQAATLTAGSYVKLGLVAYFGYAPGQGSWGIDWNFTGPVVSSGPFSVTQPDPLWPQRMVSVPTTAYNVPSGTGVFLYGQSALPLPGPATDLQITSETNYDPSQMLVGLHVQHSDGSSQLLWTETRNGNHNGGGSVLWPGQTILPTDTIYFTVAAVPEPSSGLAVLLPSIGMLWMRRRSAR